MAFTLRAYVYKSGQPMKFRTFGIPLDEYPALNTQAGRDALLASLDDLIEQEDLSEASVTWEATDVTSRELELDAGNGLTVTVWAADEQTYTDVLAWLDAVHPLEP